MMPSRRRARSRTTPAYIAIAVAGLVVACADRGTQSTGRTGGRDSVAAGDSTSPAAAAAVVRDYYDAIDGRDYRRAYRIWVGEGAASGQTYDDFALGFANTERVEARVGVPGRVEGAAGSRYVEVQVVIHAVTRQGGEQRFGGVYVLRRSVVDGATEAQRRWHIDSAKITHLP